MWCQVSLLASEVSLHSRTMRTIFLYIYYIIYILYIQVNKKSCRLRMATNRDGIKRKGNKIGMGLTGKLFYSRCLSRMFAGAIFPPSPRFVAETQDRGMPRSCPAPLTGDRVFTSFVYILQITSALFAYYGDCFNVKESGLEDFLPSLPEFCWEINLLSPPGAYYNQQEKRRDRGNGNITKIILKY